jgi:hypothetical protein
MMAGWFLFVGMWTLASLAFLFDFHQAFGWILPLSGALGICFGIGLLRFAKYYYRADTKLILELLEETLNGERLQHRLAT